jgi:glycosyltransferase involved in cell wall biosynthesis
VLYVIGSLGRGGAEKQLHVLLTHLDRRAFSPAVVTLSVGGTWVEPIRRLGVPLTELPRHGSFDVRRLVSLYRIIRRTGPDIVQTFTPPDTAYGFVAARLARVPILIASRRSDRYPDHPLALQRVSRWLWRWSSAIICNAERSRRNAPPALASRHVVIRNGMDPLVPGRSRGEVRRELGVPDDATVVGTVARLVPEKNQRLLIEVAAKVTEGTPARLLVVGGGPLEADLRTQAQALGMADRVVFTGERDDVADLLGAMDVFVLTSDREGLPNAVMEAMSVGLPCVVTDVGDSGELVREGETGFVCPPGDLRQLADRVARLVADPGLRLRLGARARARVADDFSPEAMAAATQALYRRLLQERSPAPARIGAAAAAGPAKGGGR